MNATIREVHRKLLVRVSASELMPASLRSLSTSTASNACREPKTSSLQPSRAELLRSHLPQSNSFVKYPPVRFSSAVSLDEYDESPKKTRTNRSRNPLIVTPQAASRIHNLISNHNQSRNEDKAIGIRLGTKKRGCNGLSYTLDYAYENHSQQHKRDEAMDILFDDATTVGHGLKVFIEPMALMNVIGTKMDFTDDEMSSEFTFTNPNSKGECGCGESFNV